MTTPRELTKGEKAANVAWLAGLALLLIAGLIFIAAVRYIVGIGLCVAMFSGGRDPDWD